ncbi:LamG domain-containing protein [Psychrobium sp. 1_MG-2023]|uniref:LamG domain-containing protein n=1 Tax=Psychrobium sp. 1_MG-2023 TaxID=3062624 RepID=UPI000C33EDDD|nr:LamG domain-containing protein [Psychrobium sp. 1_MG-2023]MDP2562866.1 LamG domain-containing protein [Psychrobium sp. 1_MG-2023]PKF53970.1 ATPase [Alteromonadales bacterium alter-6D02]
MRLSLLLPLSVLLLSACGGESTVTETPEPPPTTTGPFVYNGPTAQTADIQQFKNQLWDNVVGEDKCGACHNQSGQNPQFARTDDVNLAYGAVSAIINKQQPEQSLLIEKVANGHNCWLSSDSACSDILTTWLTNWLDVEQQSNVIQLIAPIDKSPGSNKRLPDNSSAFATTVHPLTQTYCSDCHASSAQFPISPYFAEADVDIAYQAAATKLDLNNPQLSRLVARLTDEFHNCWSDCRANGQSMLDAVNALAQQVPTTTLADDVVHSKALTLPEGIVASGGSRFEQHVIAKYQFKAGSGQTAFDTSGISPALDLQFNGDVSWVGGWGIHLNGGRAQGSTSSSKKLYDLISATGEYSIEAWVTPANVTQEGPARIVSYSGGKDSRNVTLGQTLYNYDHLLRTAETNVNGLPALSTNPDAEVLQASLQHVVINYDPINGRQIFVNGQHTGDEDDVTPGSLAEWDPTFALVLGNEVSGEFPWLGSIRMLAIHNRALAPEQIRQNHSVGVGERFYLLFGVSELTSVAQSYIVFEVSQFDNYSYLFKQPFFISLDPNAAPQGIAVKNMRIGINGAEPSIGQAFDKLELTLNADSYTSGSGQPISGLGTLIPLEHGSELDEFFLTFEQLGTHQHVRVDAVVTAPTTPADVEEQSRLGIRLFSEINRSMAQITGVSPQNTEVKPTYDKLRQQLPSTTDINGFLASNQMAISQLAIKYCSALVDDPSARANYFPSFNFNQVPSDAFTSGGKDLIINPLLTQAIATGLDNQASRAEVKQELELLTDKLSLCSNPSDCNNQRTLTIIKANCAAVVGSAITLLQ